MKQTLTLLALTLLVLAVTHSNGQGQDKAYYVNIVNSASQADGYLGGVARGSLATIYVQPLITAETINFSKWVQETPTGASISLDNCTSDPVTAKKLPILSVSVVGKGDTAYNQFNVYIPNDIGDEPYGTCQHLLPSNLLPKYTFRPAPGFGAEFSTFANILPSFPGIFTANGSGAGAPAGFHLNATTGAMTSISNCNTTPEACPVSTNGQPNYLVLYLTGGEALGCNESGDKKCSEQKNFFETPHFRLNSLDILRLSVVEQPLLFYGTSGYLGVEQANLQIKPGTQAGRYTLSVTGGGGCALCQIRQLPVTLGPAN